MSSRDFFKKNQTKKSVSRQTLADSINSGTRKKKKLNSFIFCEKIRSDGRPSFPKAKFDHINFNVVFQNLLEKRHLNDNSFLCTSKSL